MSNRSRSWVPGEPEAPDDDARSHDVLEIGAMGLSDVRTDRLIVSSAPDLHLVRVEIERLEAAGTSLPGLTVRDASFAGGDLANADLADVRLRRVRVSEFGAVGIDVSGAVLDEVVLTRCKLRLARGFGVRMTRCIFDGCDLREAEFEGATLDRVVFRDCNLMGARLAGVDLSRCDLRGSRVEGLVVSPDHLRGVRVDASQLPTFAVALGLDLGEAPA